MRAREDRRHSTDSRLAARPSPLSSLSPRVGPGLGGRRPGRPRRRGGGAGEGGRGGGGGRARRGGGRKREGAGATGGTEEVETETPRDQGRKETERPERRRPLSGRVGAHGPESTVGYGSAPSLMGSSRKG